MKCSRCPAQIYKGEKCFEVKDGILCYQCIAKSLRSCGLKVSPVGFVPVLLPDDGVYDTEDGINYDFGSVIVHDYKTAITIDSYFALYEGKNGRQ